MVKILAALVAALSILNSSGASPGAPEKVAALVTALHVSDAYGAVSTHLCLHIILKTHAKSNHVSIGVANLWVIEAIINNNRSKFLLSKLVLCGVCRKHFMYKYMHHSCTLSCVHVEC